VMQSTKNVLVIDKNGGGKDFKHSNSLFVPKQDYAYRLEEIPFAHPRQLAQILPILRQWVCFGSLLEGVFATSDNEAESSRSSTGMTTIVPPVNKVENRHPSLSITTNGSLKIKSHKNPSGKPNNKPLVSATDLLSLPESNTSLVNQGESTSEKTETASPLQIDISLATTPTPSLTIGFETNKRQPNGVAASNDSTTEGRPASVTIAVLQNAEIVITSQNIVPESSQSSSSPSRTGQGQDGEENNASNNGNGMEDTAAAAAAAQTQVEMQRMARAVDVCGDLGIWVEWVRGRY